MFAWRWNLSCKWAATMTKRPWSHHWLVFKIIVSMHSGRCKRPKHHKVSLLRARQTFCHVLSWDVPCLKCCMCSLAPCLRKDLVELEVIQERSNEKDPGDEVTGFWKETTKVWDPSLWTGRISMTESGGCWVSWMQSCYWPSPWTWWSKKQTGLKLLYLVLTAGVKASSTSRLRKGENKFMVSRSMNRYQKD